MIDVLLEPFTYQYMTKAIWLSGLVCGICAFLSAFLMLKGWSLMGDALAHAVVPGVALSYLLALPYAAGAFTSGFLAAASMAIVRQKTKLREDAVIGLIFTSFFALGLLIVSLKPTAISIQTIILGNLLAIPDEDVIQVLIISVVTLFVLCAKWKDFKIIFFDPVHARSLGLPVTKLQILFFTILSAATVAALQTVGACLVIATVITPGATAYLLTDRFDRLILISVFLGALTGAGGAYLSYFVDGATGGVIVLLQTFVFLLAFLFAPKYGLIAQKTAQKSRGIL